MNEQFFGFPFDPSVRSHGVGGTPYPPRQSKRMVWLLLRNGAASRFASLWPNLFQDGLTFPNLDPPSQAGDPGHTVFLDPRGEAAGPPRVAPGMDPRHGGRPSQNGPRRGPKEREVPTRQSRVDRSGYAEPVGGSPGGRSGEGSHASPDAFGPELQGVAAVSSNRVTVRFVDFRHLLSGQISQPLRLGDSHLLPCDANVYHLSDGVTVSRVAEALRHTGRSEDDLAILTRSAAQRLELEWILEEWQRGQLRDGRQRQVEQGGTLLFHLRLLCDPTAEEVGGDRRADFDPREGRFVERERNAFDERPSTCGANRATELRRAIPQSYLKPWEMPVSREEAVYAMNVSSRFGSVLVRAVRRLVQEIFGGADRRRWRNMLAGRSLEAQLWAVRPPRGAFACSSVRKWVTDTLRLAGYDAEAMLPEWEIYWRRKGL